MRPFEGHAVGTALAARIDQPSRSIPGHGYTTTVGRATGGVFPRLSDHRPKQGDVVPRGVAISRVAAVLAAPSITIVSHPDGSSRARRRDHRAETAVHVVTSKPSNSWSVTTRSQSLLLSQASTPKSQFRTMLDAVIPPGQRGKCHYPPASTAHGHEPGPPCSRCGPWRGGLSGMVDVQDVF